MSDDQVNGNSAVLEADPASGGQATSSSAETVSQNGQAPTQAQSAPVEDSFSSLDPATLPPELQAIYKNLQADYTKKTMSLADTRKKAQAYDQISGDQRFVDYWKGLNQTQKADYKEQKAEVEKALGADISDDEFQKSFNDRDGFMTLMKKLIMDGSTSSQKKIDQLEQKLSVKDAADVVESFATEAAKDGKLVRPDFYALDEDQLITGYLNVNPPENTTETAYLSKLNEAYGWAKAVSQKYYDKGKAEALQLIQKKANGSMEMPTNATKGMYTGPDPKKISVKEALDLARKGQRVPRDD